MPFVQTAATPVQLAAGPDGDLFYVDYGIVDGVVTAQAGAIHRITYLDPAPVAELTANRISGGIRKTYRFSAAGTKDPNKRALTYTWDADGNGSFETSTGSSPRLSRRYSARVNVTVSVRATNSIGRSDTASLTVYPGNHAPRFTKVSPSRSLTWRVGQKVRFVAQAKDKDQRLRSAAYTWSLSIRHCPEACHTHPIDQWPGSRRGSFRAPDHEYPSHLLLDVSVTDARGHTVNKTVRIDPKSVDITFATKPAGLKLTAGGGTAKGPFTRTFIVGGHLIASAAPTQKRRGVTYRFQRWSDGGKSSHDIVAPQRATTRTATYRAAKALVRVAASKGLAVKVDGKRTTRFRDDVKVGSRRTVSAPKKQKRDGVTWVFVRWSDGGAREHRITVGAQRVDVRAVYRKA